MLPARLQTPRLVLRPVAGGDRSAVVAALSDWQVTRWLRPVPWPFGDAGFDELVAAARPGAQWAVTDGGGFAGMVGLAQGEGALRLGYWIAPGRQGRGYATEAAGAVLAAADAAWPNLPVASYHLEGNDLSGRVLRRLGFSVTGQGTVFSRPHGRDMPTVTFLRPARAVPPA
jgi:RimJ/RimL family protein N-acetyltransferase